MSQTALAALFGGAQSQGALSPAAAQIIDIDDLGADIQNALGISVDDITSSEVTLVTLLIDDSGSIRFAGNTQAVRDGHNVVLDSLTATKQKDSILVMCRYLNGKVLYPFTPVAQAPHMDASNYDPLGGTPLYDESVTTAATVIAKTQEFVDNGVACRSVTVIVTDGGDASSHRNSATDVKKLVRDMYRQECHIVAFMGVDDGLTDFRQVAKDMGVADEWILTPGNSPSEIRRAFAMVSQSAVRASQSAGTSFSQAAMGGFASP
jgi:hypothetical protein